MRWSGSGRVPPGFLDVHAAGRGLPPVPAWLGWVTFQPGACLTRWQARLARRVARARCAALVIGLACSKSDHMRAGCRAETCRRCPGSGRGAGAGRSACSSRLVSMVTLQRRHRVQAHGELAPAGSTSVQVPKPSRPAGLPRGMKDQGPRDSWARHSMPDSCFSSGRRRSGGRRRESSGSAGPASR